MGHGDIPGDGAPQPALDAKAMSTDVSSQSSSDTCPPPTCPPRRCTLMVAFCRERPKRGQRHGLDMPQDTTALREQLLWTRARCTPSSTCSLEKRCQIAAASVEQQRSPKVVP